MLKQTPPFLSLMIQKIFIEARHFAGARYAETNKVYVVLCFFLLFVCFRMLIVNYF